MIPFVLLLSFFVFRKYKLKFIIYVIKDFFIIEKKGVDVKSNIK